MSQFISNVLNTIGEQEPDLPSIKLDSMAMSIVIPQSSTREKLQFISGNVDGTVRFHSARPAHEWWKPEMYDDKDLDYESMMRMMKMQNLMWMMWRLMRLNKIGLSAPPCSPSAPLINSPRSKIC